MTSKDMYKLSESDFIWSRFCAVKNALEKYILHSLSNETFAINVASKFEDVLRHCDEIDYSDDETAVAYCILHFLPRYRMFQMIYSKLSDKHILPIRRNPIRTLDIGTGPGPSMYALSDIFCSLVNIGVIKPDIQHIPDYVEKSIGFRNTLHHFTEVANAYHSVDDMGWNVPYHHGSFDDFADIDFNPTLISYWNPPRTIRFRFDMITCSNFFTTLDQVKAQEKEIKDCVRYLRHKGLFIVIGARRGRSDITNKNYKKIYDSIKETIINTDYSKPVYSAWASCVSIKNHTFFVDTSDKYGQVIAEFYRSIMRTFRERGYEQYIPENVRNSIMKCLNPDYKFHNYCEVHVFKKFAFPKRHKYRRRYKK